MSNCKSKKKLISINVKDEELIRNNVSDSPINEKQAILDYFHSIPAWAVAPGVFKDIFTGKIVIGIEAFEDGVYYWHSDTVYYFEKYNLKLPDDFIAYVLSKKE